MIYAAPTSTKIEVSNSNAAPTSANVETGEEHAALGNFKQNLAEHNQKHLRQMQLKLVDILREITTLCDRHNIPYWLDSGTLLGAVRHGGFIPWDDDADITMTRSDFAKLVAALGVTAPEYFVKGRIKKQFYKVDDDQVWVDIFICDYIVSSSKCS